MLFVISSSKSIPTFQMVSGDYSQCVIFIETAGAWIHHNMPVVSDTKNIDGINIGDFSVPIQFPVKDSFGYKSYSYNSNTENNNTILLIILVSCCIL